MTNRIPGLTFQDVLALRAATDELPFSVEAWRKLSDLTPFDQIEVNTQRIAPAIYNNLKDAGSFTDRDRLKGTYKHSWSRNTRSFHALAPVAQQLELNRINYRLIKGAAVQLTLGHLGARIMGDIDIVVGRSDVEMVNRILISHEFKPNFNSPCVAFHAGTPKDALNYNNRECHVDVHIAEHKDPTKLYTFMLESAPISIEYGETTYLIADPTLLLLTAAAHGKSNFGATDLIQACTDIALLSELTSVDLIRKYAERTETQLDVDYMYRVLAGANLDRFSTGIPDQVLVNRARAWLIHKQRILQRLRKRLVLINRRTRKFQERRLSLFAIKSTWRPFRGRRLRYIIWLATGRFSPVEIFLLRRKRTFLLAPREVLSFPYSTCPFQGHLDSKISVNKAPMATQDWRFTIHLKAPQKVLTLTLDSRYFDNFDADLFWMGRHYVRVVSGDKSMLHIVFRDVPTINEFSIRPALSLCEECSRSLNSLQVDIDKG